MLKFLLLPRDESAVDTVEESKRLDADVAAQIAANILNLIQLGIGADVNVSAKREDTVAAQIGANILNLIQAAVGADAKVDLKDSMPMLLLNLLPIF